MLGNYHMCVCRSNPSPCSASRSEAASASMSGVADAFMAGDNGENGNYYIV